MAQQMTGQNTQDAVVRAREKSTLLYSFFENIKNGGEILTTEDLDIAIESLKLAQLDIKAQEERRRQEREAELLKKRMEEAEQRRRQAEVRAAKRAERKRRERAKQITAMDLPMDYSNRFEEDARANIHCDSIAEGLLVSLDALGLVDIEFISAVTGEEMKTVIESLKGSIYQNPLHWGECYYKGWETADEYLSGNLMHKLAVAREANEEFPGMFEDNIQALKEVISPELSTDEIYITLGSPWVPTDVIDDFILHMIGVEHDEKAAAPFSDKKYATRHDDVTGLWEIPDKTRFRKSHEHGKYEHINYHVYGTVRMDMLYLLENILNMKTIAIYDTPDPTVKNRILNQQQTVKILEKQEKMIGEFKNWVWQDEKRKLRLQNAYCRRYGNIRKRVFDAVEMDGTKVHRANLHNLSHFESFRFGVGDRILVYKANRIVPQIAENRMRSGTYDLPKYCPCCGEVLTVRVTPGGVRELYCPNKDCLARHAQKLARFCDKNAMDIDGLSASVLEKMMAYGWIRNFADIYHLEMHRDDILSRPGFGMDWYNGVQAAIEKSRRCHMHQFLSGIGIPHLGPEAARILHRYYYGSMDDFLRDAAVEFPFFHISGISELKTRKIHAWFEDAKNVRAMRTVMAELTFLGKNRELEGKNNPFTDTTVAVTGTFDGFTREGILELLTSLGADVTEEITADTDYLIFGAVPSGRKVSLAMQYGVNVISEKGLSEMLAKTPAENR